ncbi:hypothetical protein QR685DRAFT_509690 [Neurospora intermedia]|uniref:Uncharacterized protein n=1 Tax=Neurospora intermedia TaxID=5142 RepID=A0ABR3DPU1_NEUIN
MKCQASGRGETETSSALGELRKLPITSSIPPLSLSNYSSASASCPTPAEDPRFERGGGAAGALCQGKIHCRYLPRLFHRWYLCHNFRLQFLSWNAAAGRKEPHHLPQYIHEDPLAVMCKMNYGICTLPEISPF